LLYELQDATGQTPVETLRELAMLTETWRGPASAN
jgi:hypothetical protein